MVIGVIVVVVMVGVGVAMVPMAEITVTVGGCIHGGSCDNACRGHVAVSNCSRSVHIENKTLTIA